MPSPFPLDVFGVSILRPLPNKIPGHACHLLRPRFLLKLISWKADSSSTFLLLCLRFHVTTLSLGG